LTKKEGNQNCFEGHATRIESNYIELTN